MALEDAASVVTPGSVDSRLVIRCAFRGMGLLCARWLRNGWRRTFYRWERDDGTPRQNAEHAIGT